MIYLANTDVECEWEEDLRGDLDKDSFATTWHPPLFFQLQFLPLLYARAEEVVVVTDKAPQTYIDSLHAFSSLVPNPLAQLISLRECEASFFQGRRLLSWGASLRLKKWADRLGLEYHIPPWEVVKKINSKAFSYQHSPLKGVALLESETDLKSYLRETSKERVLKNCFGMSGRGNMRFNCSTPYEKLVSFCRQEWLKKRPVIAEPWLDRELDFSTQWYVHAKEEPSCPKIEYIGATIFQTDARGSYLGTIAGEGGALFGPFLDFLEEHLAATQKILEEIAALGFFGSVGLDAFVYREEESKSLRLQPLVEINARQTMSLMALKMQKERFPGRSIALFFDKSQEGLLLLPSELHREGGRKMSFTKNLHFKFV